MVMKLSTLVAFAAAVSAAPLSLRERQRAVLQEHIDAPWPSTKPSGESGDVSNWGESNVVLARLADDRLGQGLGEGEEVVHGEQPDRVLVVAAQRLRQGQNLTLQLLRVE